MKGIIFTEFIEMAEDKYGYAVIDEIIESSNLPSQGIYTVVGTYEHQEMVTLVTKLSQRINQPVNELLKNFGKHLFKVLHGAYPYLFEQINSSFDLLEQIDRHIHFEVRKLYADAELPKFEISKLSENVVEMVYISERKMSDLAEGLIEATFEHFGEKAVIKKEKLNSEGSKVKFVITKE